MRTWGCLFAVVVVALACASAAAATPLTPNDPTWEDFAWGQRQVQMPNAWEITTGDPRVIVAVVDTGVDPTIPDLQGALAPGWDFVNNDGVPRDYQGHGTAVATEIVARGNNGQGIAGYCWACRIMPIRVSSSGADFDPLLSARGIIWAVDHGARIVSLSFSDEGAHRVGEPNVAAAIAYAAQRGVLVMASSGNTGLPYLTWPAADPGAYAVAATDPADLLYRWSTFGSWIDLAAPGCQLMIIPGDIATMPCGTSTSTPAVAGIAALMLSVNLSLTPAQIISALQQTAVPVNGIGGGRVDAYRALLAVGGKVPPPPAPPARPVPPAVGPPPHPRTLWQRPPAGPKLATRVQRGVLLRHRQVTINVRAGRVAATLQSAKARSCVVSLRSNSDVWLSSATRRDAVSVTAKVPDGRYKVEVSCKTPRASRFALYLRAVFATK